MYSAATHPRVKFCRKRNYFRGLVPDGYHTEHSIAAAISRQRQLSRTYGTVSLEEVFAEATDTALLAGDASAPLTTSNAKSHKRKWQRLRRVPGLVLDHAVSHDDLPGYMYFQKMKTVNHSLEQTRKKT